MFAPHLLAGRLFKLKRPKHTKAHGEHRYDTCPTCLSTIDKRSIEVEFPPFGELVLGNFGTGRSVMSNRKLTFFERLSIDTELLRTEDEHSYLNSTQVNLILEFLGIKHEGSDLASYVYDYSSSAHQVISVDESEKAAKNDMLMNIRLQYNVGKIRFSAESDNEKREHRRSKVSNEFGVLALKSLAKYGEETKELRRQETMLAIKKELQPANDRVLYAPFFEKKPSHNKKTLLKKQQKRIEFQSRSLVSNSSNELGNAEDLLLGVV